jgi:hypothetical protein
VTEALPLTQNGSRLPLKNGGNLQVF